MSQDIASVFSSKRKKSKYNKKGKRTRHSKGAMTRYQQIRTHDLPEVVYTTLIYPMADSVSGAAAYNGYWLLANLTDCGPGGGNQPPYMATWWGQAYKNYVVQSADIVLNWETDAARPVTLCAFPCVDTAPTASTIGDYMVQEFAKTQVKNATDGCQAGGPFTQHIRHKDLFAGFYDEDALIGTLPTPTAAGTPPVIQVYWQYKVQGTTGNIIFTYKGYMKLHVKIFGVKPKVLDVIA